MWDTGFVTPDVGAWRTMPITRITTMLDIGYPPYAPRSTLHAHTQRITLHDENGGCVLLSF